MYDGVPIARPVTVRSGSALFRRLPDRARDPEVGDDRVVVLEQDVGRLDVAVHDPLPMRVVERIRHFLGQVDHFGDGERSVAHESLLQRLAVDERHRVVQDPRRLACAEERDHVRMPKRGGHLDLASEAFGVHAGPDLCGDDLHDHSSIERDLERLEDAAHTTPAELAHDLVGAGQARW